MEKLNLSASALAMINDVDPAGFLRRTSGGLKGGPAMQVRKSLVQIGAVEKVTPVGTCDAFQNGDATEYALRPTALGRLSAGLPPLEPAEVEAPSSDASGEGPVAPVPTVAETAPDGVPDQSKQDIERSRSRLEREQDDAKPAAAKAGSKTAQMVDLLKRPEGATLAELQAALGWQPHTTRASISTAAKKGLIAAPVKAKEDGRGTVYRVAA